MEEVIAVSFRDRRRAAQAFHLLRQMNDQLVIELDDAVVVHRDCRWRPAWGPFSRRERAGSEVTRWGPEWNLGPLAWYGCG